MPFSPKKDILYNRQNAPKNWDDFFFVRVVSFLKEKAVLQRVFFFYFKSTTYISNFAFLQPVQSLGNKINFSKLTSYFISFPSREGSLDFSQRSFF